MRREVPYEGRDVVARAHLALPLADAEDLGLELDLHVLFDLDLTGRPAAFAGVAAGNEGLLGRQHSAASVMDVDLADAAAAHAAAGRGHEDLLLGEGAEQARAGGDLRGFVDLAVDVDGHLDAVDELSLGEHQHDGQGDDHGHEGRDAHDDREHFGTHVVRLLVASELDAGEGHEADHHEAPDDEGEAEAPQGLRHVAVAHPRRVALAGLP
jgi:hypothetical protein